MNSVVLINSYCDNDEKLNILYNNISKIKNLGIDIILHSPISLPNYIINECLVYHQTSVNPILTWPEKVMVPWVIHQLDSVKVTMGRSLVDHGWAALYQVKKLSEIAVTYDYDVYHHITYDLLINDDVIDILTNKVKYNFNPFNEHKVGLVLMSFTKENLLDFIPLINKDSYVSFGDIVETWLFNLINENQLFTISNTIVNDSILYHGNNDLFNYSPFEDIKYFIINDADKNEIKLYFHNFEGVFDIKLIIDNNEFKHKVMNGYIINLPYNRNNILKTILSYNDKTFDITSTISEITHNYILIE